MEGNQVLGVRAPALRIDSLDPPAPRSVRLEGTGFYLHGRVGVVLAEPRRIRAIVRGARPFDVTVALDETGKPSVECDCTAFRDRKAVCRHVWATLIEIQNERLLAAPAVSVAAR